MSTPLRITIVTDVAACKALWDAWSPRAALCDLWEFRFAFYNAFHFPLHFVVADREGDTVGVLPLWYQKELERYLWFGDTGDEFNWQEDTTFWVQDSEVLRTLLTEAPTPLVLTSLTEDAAHMAQELFNDRVRPMNSKAVLPLDDIQGAEQFLERLPKKLRSNVRRDLRRMAELKIEMVYDDPSDFEVLVQMNKSRFEDSPFYDPRLEQVFRSLRTSGPFTSHLFAARLHGKTIAVDCVFLWNRIMYPMLCAADIEAASGIGHYMNIVDIEQALAHNVHLIDFAETEEPSIKTKLFPIVPQYIYEAL